MHRYGIDLHPLDDTMLISYVLDAGEGSHSMDSLCDRWLGHKPLAHKELIGSGKSSVTFDKVSIERATEYAAEDADVTLQLWRLLKPRLVADGLDLGLRAAGAATYTCARAHGRARYFRRSPDSFAPVG